MSGGRRLIAGGRVIDPGSGIDDRIDLPIDGERLADPGTPSAGGDSDTIDASGALVVPGLIDLHGHWYEASPFGIDPLLALRAGTTCAVDAGTAGYGNFAAFRRDTIDVAEVRVLAFIHVAAAGLATIVVGELEDLRYARPLETAAVVRANRDVVVGVKVRIGRGISHGDGHAALSAALEAAHAADVPLMCHISEGADAAAIVRRLRAGDIVTHAFTASGRGILDERGRVDPAVREARGRGVLFDIGAGCGSFSWATARRAIDEGFAPDTISTDLHRLSITHPVVDLPTTMSRFLHLGMSLPEVVAAATVVPARAIGRPEMGTLRPGSTADVAVLELGSGDREIQDAHGVGELVSSWLSPRLTVRAGRVIRPEEIPVRLREYLPADELAGCTSPLR